MEKKIKTLGVICGRFQCPALTEGHKHLIKESLKHCDELLILVGQSVANIHDKDSLPYELVRHSLVEFKQSLKSKKEIYINFIKDHTNFNWWQDNLHAIIEKYLYDENKVILFGSRDSFLKTYTGHYIPIELSELPGVSATEVRKSIKPILSYDFKAGVIWSQENRFPIVYSTVDICVWNSDVNKILLGRKPGNTLWQFPGGFVDVTDKNLISAVKRELREECPHISVHQPFYTNSFQIEDFRYAHTKDQIMTHFFEAITRRTNKKEKMIAGDDLEEINYFTRAEAKRIIIPQHLPLLKSLK